MGDYPRVLSHIAYRPPRRKTPEWIVIVATARQHFTIFCSCAQWGPGCAHAADVRGQMKPWWKARTTYSDHRRAA